MTTDAKPLPLSDKELAYYQTQWGKHGVLSAKPSRLLATIEADRATIAKQADQLESQQKRIGELEAENKALREAGNNLRSLVFSRDDVTMLALSEWDAALSASPTPPAQQPQASADRLVEALELALWHLKEAMANTTYDPDPYETDHSKTVVGRLEAALAAHKESKDA